MILAVERIQLARDLNLVTDLASVDVDAFIISDGWVTDLVAAGPDPEGEGERSRDDREATQARETTQAG